jgi:hypothetical protein
MVPLVEDCKLDDGAMVNERVLRTTQRRQHTTAVDYMSCLRLARGFALLNVCHRRVVSLLMAALWEGVVKSLERGFVDTLTRASTRYSRTSLRGSVNGWRGLHDRRGSVMTT